MKIVKELQAFEALRQVEECLRLRAEQYNNPNRYTYRSVGSRPAYEQLMSRWRSELQEMFASNPRTSHSRINIRWIEMDSAQMDSAPTEHPWPAGSHLGSMLVHPLVLPSARISSVVRLSACSINCAVCLCGCAAAGLLAGCGVWQ